MDSSMCVTAATSTTVFRNREMTELVTKSDDFGWVEGWHGGPVPVEMIDGQWIESILVGRLLGGHVCESDRAA